MPTYSYIAKSAQGEDVSGKKTAKDEHELAGILRQEGDVLISAREEGKAGTSILQRIKDAIPFIGKISLAEKMLFTRNLRIMVKAGVPLPRGLRILSGQSKKALFKRTLEAIADEVTKGRSFSEAISHHPRVFSELFQSMVEVGEASGTLEDVLQVLTRQMEREYGLKSKIKGAMTYPIVIVTAMVGIGILMMIMVVPKLSDTFKELKIELPITTQLVIGTGNFLARFWYLLPVIVLAIFIIFRFLLSLKSGKRAMDALLLRAPIISALLKKTNAAYTVRTLSSLIASGVPIVRALDIVAKTLGNVYFRQAIEEAAKNVSKGGQLSESLKPHQDIFPVLVVQMIEVGEETGQSADILEKLADFYEEEVSEATKNMASIIEPVLMIVIGAAVGFFGVSMIQPMYSMMGSL